MVNMGLTCGLHVVNMLANMLTVVCVNVLNLGLGLAWGLTNTMQS